MASFRSEHLRGRLYVTKITREHDIDGPTDKHLSTEEIFFDFPVMTDFRIDDELQSPGLRRMRVSFNGVARLPPWDLAMQPPTAEDLATHLGTLAPELLQAALVRMDEIKEQG